MVEGEIYIYINERRMGVCVCTRMRDKRTHLAYGLSSKRANIFFNPTTEMNRTVLGIIAETHSHFMAFAIPTT